MVVGERRWERASRAVDFPVDATNLRIKRLAAEESPSAVAAAVAREVRKRWLCLVSAHCGGNGNVSFFLCRRWK